MKKENGGARERLAEGECWQRLGYASTIEEIVAAVRFYRGGSGRRVRLGLGKWSLAGLKGMGPFGSEGPSFLFFVITFFMAPAASFALQSIKKKKSEKQRK
jgi:hypothetical protein